MTYEEIIAQTDHAFIEVDENGFVRSINGRFTELLGWDESIVGKPLTSIVPDHMHDAHHLGFSRFVMTGEPHILEADLKLPTRHRSGRQLELVHHIAAATVGESWRFASMIRTGDE